jgi:hypothetical protein
MSKIDLNRSGFWRKCYNLGDYIFVNKPLINSTLFENSTQETIYVSLYFDHLIQFVVFIIPLPNITSLRTIPTQRQKIMFLPLVCSTRKLKKWMEAK